MIGIKAFSAFAKFLYYLAVIGKNFPCFKPGSMVK
jgi:hypothetical protein